MKNSLYFFFLLIITIGCKEPVIQEEAKPRISIQNVTKFEGDETTEFNFQVFLDKTSTEEITVEYDTEDDTAEAGSDFVKNQGILTFAPGEKNTTISIEIITDINKETDEVFNIILSNPMNATIAQGKATGTIRNEDTFIVIPEDGYITPESYAGYTLDWKDEFEGTGLNTNDWTYEIGNSGWGNNEWQYYTDEPENSYINDGNLVIEAREESYNGADYTSARLITQNKQLFTHGRVDIRAILPEGQGIWPALWMLGTNISDIGWPECGEIDIMEIVGHEPSTTHGTAHWLGTSGHTYKGGSYKLSDGEKFSDKYHVFSIIWEPGEIKWYLDDNLFYTINNAMVDGNYPFDQEFFFIFNVAVGGNWPGYPDATTVFPQKMTVDYIRVFNKN